MTCLQVRVVTCTYCSHRRWLQPTYIKYSEYDVYNWLQCPPEKTSCILDWKQHYFEHTETSTSRQAKNCASQLLRMTSMSTQRPSKTLIISINVQKFNPLKHSGTLWSVQSHPGLTYIFNFCHSGTLPLRAQWQSARMSEIRNGRLGLDGQM